ncbi:unnamed protein product [Protopolystoma xenopodis]|uniref:LITAF domain-containing protein n=1 Tax=Protopolystoma xenopodis TaxID=117903 RepID=A0A448WBP9_9PLAT|nr:unnamed protein product [Protopolystoma xenopodis]
MENPPAYYDVKNMPPQPPYPVDLQMPTPYGVTGPGYPQTSNYQTTNFPAPNYFPGQGSQAPVIVQQPTTVIIPQNFGHRSQAVTCPFCQQTISSSVTYESGVFTWLMCGVVAILGGIICCCLIPFCVDGCKDAVHACPKCKRMLGSYKII